MWQCRDESTVHECCYFTLFSLLFHILCMLLNDLLIFHGTLTLFQGFLRMKRNKSAMCRFIGWTGVLAQLLKWASCCFRLKQNGRKDVWDPTGVSIFMAIKCTAELDIMTSSHPANSLY